MEAKGKPKSNSAYFKPGSAVEVSIDNDAFRGSQFPGTIIGQVASGRFLVEYHNLITDKQSHKPLREILSLHQLRPLPPPESHKEFKSGDKVDTFYNGGWWEGQVTEDLGNGRFGVDFSVSKNNMVFPKEQLRAHREWINHNWVPPLTNHKVPARGRETDEMLVLKRQRQSITTRKDDRISDLPESVLLHILNFMDTKSAVQTCVLSKRWKDLCKCLTNLTFYSNTPFHSEVEIFKRFASWVLGTRDDSCSLLNLVVDSWIEPKLLERVVKYALLHNVQQLTLGRYTGFRPNCESLSLIFCCQSLTSLKLFFGWWVKSETILPKSLYMPALKILHLGYVRFTASDNGYAEPFSNCHALNTLVLGCCYFHEDEQVLCISNSTLSSLTIFEGQAYQITLSTPNLRSFAISGTAGHQLFSACNLSFLEEVNIDIPWNGTGWYGKTSIIIGWLQALANVKMLTFSWVAFQMILHDVSNPSSMTPQPPCFLRLESLKVDKQSANVPDVTDEEVNRVVEYLLQNSPMDRLDITRSA